MYPMNRKTSRETGKDQAFKALMRDKNVLVMFVGDLLEEFKGMTREEVMRYLPLNGDGKTVEGCATELVSEEDGAVFLDTLFRIGSPSGDLGIIMAVEGQGSGMDSASLANREQYYISRIVSDQSKDYPNMAALYRELKRTVVIWVRLHPGRERNTVVRHRFYSTYVGQEDAPVLSKLDRMEVIEVNVGCHGDEAAMDLMDMVNSLFDRQMGYEEKRRELESKYNIVLSKSMYAEVAKMGAFSEEFEIVRLDAFEEGMAKGEAKGMAKGEAKGMAKGEAKGKAEHHDEVVNQFADALEEYCLKNGTSPEDSVETVVAIPEYREPVLEEVRKRSGR